jgi:hypothetical protein
MNDGPPLPCALPPKIAANKLATFCEETDETIEQSDGRLAAVKSG